jgi:hypothetical protein
VTLESKIAALAERAERAYEAYTSNGWCDLSAIEIAEIALRAYRAERLLREADKLEDAAYLDRGYGNVDGGDEMERDARAMRAQAAALVEDE